MLAILAGIASHAPATAADAVAGKAIAQRWCVSCHLLDGRVGRDSAPSLKAVANDPNTTSDRLAAFLTQPHGGMPDLALTQGEINDLDAYIRSLRQR
jgi:mono/diheme cytochrome c family protein